MMNLNQTDLDVIRDVVKAAVADAVKTIRDELRADLYTREVVDLKFNALRDEIDNLKAQTMQNSNSLKHLWGSAAGKIVVIANGILTLYALWQILH